MQVNSTRFFSFFLVALVLFPIFVFLFKIPFLRIPPLFEWVKVLLSTLLQAGLSAFFSVLFGIFGSLGLCAFSNSVKKKRTGTVLSSARFASSFDSGFGLD